MMVLCLLKMWNLGLPFISEKMGYYFAPPGKSVESPSSRIGPLPKVYQRVGSTLHFKYGLWQLAQSSLTFRGGIKKSKIRPRSSTSVLLELPAFRDGAMYAKCKTNSDSADG